jgi:ABC-type multidrug transport system ATPase subunit
MGVEVLGLSMEYRKKARALDEVRFTAETGVVALLGPEGAGKSTLLSILATLTEPTAGTALVDGLDVRKQKAEIRRRIGYLPPGVQPYRSLSVYDTLEYLALLSNQDHPPARRLRIERALERFHLAEYRERPAASLCAGLQRRLTLAQACLCNPSVLLADEPTAGLDPEESVRLLLYLRELGREGLVLLATSSVAEAEAVAVSVAVLREGRLLFHGPPEELIAPLEGRVWTMSPEAEPGLLHRNGFLRTGLCRVGAETRLRAVSENTPVAGAEPALPNLQDAYVSLLAKN